LSLASGAFAGEDVSGAVAVVSVLSAGFVVDWGTGAELFAGGGGVFDGAEVLEGAWAFPATERVSKAVKPRCVRIRMAGLLWAASLFARAQLNMFLT
jgi:hypothetical protein